MNYPAFLAAIRDEPDSDVPRLVCADWFEDDGQSDRAEFIRVQVELSRGVRPRAVARPLLCRLRALISENRTRWLGTLTAHAPESVFERGFVEHVELSAGALLDHGRAIFDEHPIHRLALRGVGKRAAKAAACPQLSCLTPLDLRDNDGDAVAALGDSPHLGRLRALDVRSIGLGDAGLRRLLRGLRGLERLILSGNRVGTAGAEALAAAELPALSEVDLASSGVTDAGAQALAGATGLTGLRTLRLSYNPMTEAGVRAVLSSPQLAAVEQMEAYGTEMDGDARARLRSAFRNRVVC